MVTVPIIPTSGHIDVPWAEFSIGSIEHVLKTHFVPSLVGRIITDDERSIFSLPTKYGGLGIPNPVEMTDSEYEASKLITNSLANTINIQSSSFSEVDWEGMKREKASASVRKKNFHENKLQEIIASNTVTRGMKRALEFAQEKGASLWLNTQPSQEHGCFLNRQEFKDALCLRYSWEVKGIPKYCACGTKNSTDHCLTCKKGGYVSLRHNALRNTEAALLKEVCHDVKIEPVLMPIEETDDFFQLASTSTEDNARLDISARGVWSPMDRVFFDIRVTHPNTLSNERKPPIQIYKDNEKEKKRRYNERIINVEKATFTPLVFTTSGGMGPECERLNRRAAELLAEKRKEKYSDVIAYIRKRLRFSLLKATLTAIRGYRGHDNRNTGVVTELSEVAFNLA